MSLTCSLLVALLCRMIKFTSSSKAVFASPIPMPSIWPDITCFVRNAQIPKA